jgi:hypothetical protein
LQSATDAAPRISLCLPNAQSLQMVSLNEPMAAENFPAVQSMQVDAFRLGLYLPPGQSRQWDSEGAPSSSLNLPMGHRPSQDAEAFT